MRLFDPPPRDWARLAGWLARHHPDVPTIDPAELHAWLVDTTREPPLLLDVRSPDEQAVSTLPGAHCVRGVEDAQRIARVNLTPTIVVYCAVGVRSARVAAALARDGRRVFNLDEAIFGWANRGYPLVCGGMPAARVHPYDSKWAVLLAPGRRADLIC